MDKGCNPLQENYKLLLDTDSFEFTCSADNSPCESIACSCDIELIKSLISKVDMYDPYFSSTDNNFSPSQERFFNIINKNYQSDLFVGDFETFTRNVWHQMDQHIAQIIVVATIQNDFHIRVKIEAAVV